tara:strand:- start:257 stop:400 length:144 start_codon:yes stop_codon:yes gene_type:complete
MTKDKAIKEAAITKHEGFKWIQRKHYYDTNLNQSTERFQKVKKKGEK